MSTIIGIITVSTPSTSAKSFAQLEAQLEKRLQLFNKNGRSQLHQIANTDLRSDSNMDIFKSYYSELLDLASQIDEAHRLESITYDESDALKESIQNQITELIKFCGPEIAVEQ